MRTFLYLLDLLFFATLLLAPVAWIADPLEIAGFTLSWTSALLLPPLWFVIHRRLIRRWTARKRTKAPAALWETKLSKKIALAIASPFLFFLTFEYTLQWIGFESQMSPIIIQDEEGEQDDLTWAMVLDQELRWKFKPGMYHHGIKVNNLGFLDREVEPVKKPDSIRVICMGDSCTGFRGVPYSRLLHLILKKDPPTSQFWECFNMGVPGYSSVQGLRLFQKRTKELNPDVVTVYFGWNDHWISESMPDSRLMAKKVESQWGTLLETLRKKRITQLFNFLLTPKSNRVKTDGYAGFRVPAEEYRTTLTQFAEEIQSIGAVPVFITAARGTLTEHLVEFGQANSVEESTRVHDQYVEITREVAKETGSYLLDLYEIVNKGDYAETLMNEDGIHFNKDGQKKIAKSIYSKLKEIARKEEWRK